MTLLTPTLRQQMSATAARHVSQPPPALSCSTDSHSRRAQVDVVKPPPTSLSCTTSPCFCKPSFQALPFQAVNFRAPAFPLLVGHVDDIDDTPLRDWLPGCRWTGEWRRYLCGHHSTELSVSHADIDEALRRLTAAGWKQLQPLCTYYLVVDELQPERVTAMLRDVLHTSLKAHMPWVEYSARLLGYPAQASLSCARHELHRTLSGLHELGYGEQPPDVEGQEMSAHSKSVQRRWSSAALLRDRDGRRKRALAVLPRTGNVSEGEERPLVKRGRAKRGSRHTAAAAAATDSSGVTDRSAAATANSSAPAHVAEEATVSRHAAAVEVRSDDVRSDEVVEEEEAEEEDGWVVLDAAQSYPAG